MDMSASLSGCLYTHEEKFRKLDGGFEVLRRCEFRLCPSGLMHHVVFWLYNKVSKNMQHISSWLKMEAAGSGVNIPE
jgi:hypothetical protein